MHLLLLLACNAGTTTPSDGGAAGTEPPADYSYDGSDTTTPSYDQAAVETGLQQAVDVVLGISGQPIVDAYFAMLDTADDRCPTWYEQDGNVFWSDICTSDAGTSFDGYGFYYPYVDADLDGSGTLWSGDYLYGVATIIEGDGTLFHAGGGTQVLTGFNPGTDAFSTEDDSYYGLSQVIGGFQYTDPASADTWLGQGLSPDLYVYTVDYPEYGINGAYVQGGLSGLTGDATSGATSGATAVLFDDNFLYHEAAGSPCEREPTGSMQLRDADGTWWRVEFDTPDAGVLDDALCDGCGTAFLGDEEVGQACVDFSSWLDFEVLTW